VYRRKEICLKNTFQVVAILYIIGFITMFALILAEHRRAEIVLVITLVILLVI
jgi:hypothetical protein